METIGNTPGPQMSTPPHTSASKISVPSMHIAMSTVHQYCPPREGSRRRLHPSLSGTPSVRPSCPSPPLPFYVRKMTTGGRETSECLTARALPKPADSPTTAQGVISPSAPTQCLPLASLAAPSRHFRPLARPPSQHIGETPGISASRSTSTAYLR